tara:strand:+ start:6442 stop:6783 length:342 start_codon:yes stop_codon:yes gene_type:complete
MKSAGFIRLFVFFFIFFSPLRAYSGMDEFTPLDQINTWLIERKIESITNKVYCRASVPLSGTWFSSRIRLNPDDELILSPGSRRSDLIEEEVVRKVKSALLECRSSLIYISPH